MTSEIMEKIREAETKAAEITASANRKAVQSVTAARAAASDEIEQAQQQARQIAVNADEENKRMSDARIDAAREEARTQAKKIVTAAEGNMKAAVNEIIREIFEKWQ